MGERSSRLVRIPAKIFGGAATALGDHTTDDVMTEEEGQRRERSSNRDYLIKSDPGFAQKKLMRSCMTGSGGKLNFLWESTIRTGGNKNLEVQGPVLVGNWEYHLFWREGKIGSSIPSFHYFLSIPVPAFPVVGPKKINISGPNKITNTSC
jgi:hypothetical protein